MPYFVMVGEGVHPVAPIRTTRDRKKLKKPRWIDGAALDFDVPEPIVCELDPKYPGAPKAFYGAEPIPLMNDDVAAALTAAGVDNLQTFKAVLIDPESGKQFTNYRAFNLVGKISAADMEQSTRMFESDDTMISVGFDSLVIDEAKTEGLRMFRLAENLGAIIVDERVKSEVEGRGIRGIFFYPSGEWSG
jgi:hypothetical protein